MTVLRTNPWYEEAVQQGPQQAILDVLGAKFGSVPEELRIVLQGTLDLARLHALNAEAALAASLEEFRQNL